MSRFLFCCLALTFFTQSARAGEGQIPAEPASRVIAPGADVAVTIRSGRVLRGRVDRRTDDRYLWIVAEVEGMRVGSRIALHDVVRIDESEPVTLPIPVCPEGFYPPELLHQPLFPGSPRLRAPAPDFHSARPHSVDVSARAANWDDDPEADGLRIFIVPRARDGSYVVAPGSVSVSLTTFRGEWEGRVERVLHSERWGRELAAEDFGPEGAVLELPFEKLEQGRDRLLLPRAELDLRLNVSGVGTFDARQEDVELRPISLTNEFRQRALEPARNR